MLTKIIHHINQRRELNRWLKEKRDQRYLAEHLSVHLQNDIGLNQQGVEAPLTWQEPKQQVREKSRQGKERAGPRSA